MIDFIARAAGLPLLHAYKDPKGEFSHGVNFAVVGSTALPLDTLAAMRVFSPGTRSSLHVQLDWLFTYLNSTCTHHHQDCVEKVQNALFMVGEIGGNDYNFTTFQGKKSMDELRRMVPRVVKTILYGVRRTIELGAKRVVVPGNFPVGCIPIYKTAFQTNNSSAYDNNRCLKHLNEFAEYHNRELQNGINRMIQEKPNAIIVYADYYKAYEFLLHFAKHHGMDWESACCGIGGKYNFNTGRMCGARGVPVCRKADRYVRWDGIHMTQQGYRIMSSWLVRDLLPKLHCLERLP